MALAKAIAISWTGRATAPHPGATYEDKSELAIRNPGHHAYSYYKGKNIDNPNGTVTYLVSLDSNNNPLLGNGMVVALPCPPLCDDVLILVRKAIPIDDENSIPIN